MKEITNEAINKGVKIICMLEIVQSEIDELEKLGIKFNKTLKRRANWFQEELEKEIKFFYDNLHASEHDVHNKILPDGEKYFYNKVAEIENVLKDFDYEK